MGDTSNSRPATPSTESDEDTARSLISRAKDAKDSQATQEEYVPISEYSKDNEPILEKIGVEIPEDDENFALWLSTQDSEADIKDLIQKYKEESKKVQESPEDEDEKFALWLSTQDDDADIEELAQKWKRESKKAQKPKIPVSAVGPLVYKPTPRRPADAQEDFSVAGIPDDKHEEFALWLSMQVGDASLEELKQIWKKEEMRKSQMAYAQQRKRKAPILEEQRSLTQEPKLFPIPMPLPNAPLTGEYDPGAFATGVVKKTWVFGYDRQDDIKFEEVVSQRLLKQFVFCSFTIDLDWVIRKLYLEEKSPTPFVIISDWNMQERPRVKEPHMIFTGPKDVAKIMHAKFMLLFFPGWVRLVIMTANLNDFDWGEQGGVMENIVFLIDLPLRIATSESQENDPVRVPTSFQKDFEHFAALMNVPVEILDNLGSYDWSATKSLVFVHSEGRTTKGRELSDNGITSLGRKLRSAGLSNDGDIQVDYVTSTVGQLPQAFIANMYHAFQGKPISTEKNSVDPAEIAKIKQNLRIYYPAKSTVVRSKGGRNAAGTLLFVPTLIMLRNPGFPKEILTDCRSVRQRCLMHNKLIFVQPKASPVKGKGRSWAYIGSANFTTSAWGGVRYEKESMWQEGFNWECGVVIPVPLEAETSGEAAAPKRNLDAFKGIVPVPMLVEAEALSENNVPFTGN